MASSALRSPLATLGDLGTSSLSEGGAGCGRDVGWEADGERLWARAHRPLQPPASEWAFAGCLNSQRICVPRRENV